MKWCTLALFRFPKGFIPSKQGSELLKEGYSALDKGDYKKAKTIYQSMSLEDKQAKVAKGFYAAIENKRETEEYIQTLKKRHNLK